MEEPRDPVEQRRHLCGREELADAPGEPVAGQARQRGQIVRGQRLAAEVPDHGAQLVLLVEAEPVVDAPEAILGQQHMAALAVRIVGHHIEGTHAPEGGVPPRIVTQREVVRAAVLGDVALYRSFAEGAFGSLDRFGYQTPPERLGQEIGRHLTAEQSAGEVPQRAFAPPRFVDRHHLVIAQPAGHQEGCVGAPGDSSVHLHRALGEDAGNGVVSHGGSGHRRAVSVRARTVVAGGIEGEPAEWARGTTGLDQAGGVDGERGRLLAGEGDP
jgi:hypothetical protein